MQATARRLSVVSATSCARRRLIRGVRPEQSTSGRPGSSDLKKVTELKSKTANGSLGLRRSSPLPDPQPSTQQEFFARHLFVFPDSKQRTKIVPFDSPSPSHRFRSSHVNPAMTHILNRPPKTNKTDADNRSGLSVVFATSWVRGI